MQTITQEQLKEKLSDTIKKGGGIMDILKRVNEILETYKVVENTERCTLCGDLVYGIIKVHNHN